MNFMVALMSNIRTGKVLIMRPAQSIFFETGVAGVCESIEFSVLCRLKTGATSITRYYATRTQRDSLFTSSHESKP